MTNQRFFKSMAAEYSVSPALRGLVERAKLPYFESDSTFAFEIFYHPYVCQMVQRLDREQLDGLFHWPMQADAADATKPVDLSPDKTMFATDYSPNRDIVVGSDPVESLDFSEEGTTPYSQYNWELFFHAPLTIAIRASKNQRFAEAQKWFHFIFDPTDQSKFPAPARFWRMRALHDLTKSFNNGPSTLQDLIDDAAELQSEVNTWTLRPFDPHAIARKRLIAYQKTVVMKYLDNLIAWGDWLFQRDTIESINEATQLYVLAAEILGERPAKVPPPKTVADDLTFNQLLQQSNDALNDPLVDLENFVPQGANPYVSDETGLTVVTTLAAHSRYFCVPPNDLLLTYWDTVADRLFKIRHCMNLEGVVRQLPLFEPPINPALLVQAAAAGVDLFSALGEINAPLPQYRFMGLVPKAVELANDVKSLGASLLSALEKRDAEELSVLRSRQEIDLLSAVRRAKELQREEAAQGLAALNDQLSVVQARIDYFKALLGPGNDKGQQAAMSVGEKAQLDALNVAWQLNAAQAGFEIVAGIIHLIPELKLGAPTTIGASLGGENIAGALHSFGAAMGLSAQVVTTQGSMSAVQAGYARRSEEWAQQLQVATKELAQVKKQILAGSARVSIAERELENHDRQIEHARELADFFQSKFTSVDLYDWMVGQISAMYFQSYQMAYDLARRAERAYRYERGDYDASFINFGNWDSLKKGLLAGERLYFDLKRMEVAFIDQNKRELEITKHISLSLLDPKALVNLRETGQCFVSLSEDLFDRDFPGHYLRRLKTVAVSAPCVSGPYESTNCTVTLLSNSVRSSPDPGKKLMTNVGGLQSVVTSSGQNDAGMFETVLRDERFLPFEGAGAISTWRIELPLDTNTFDRETLTDFLLHIRYTARDGGEALRTKRRTELGLPGYSSIGGTPPAVEAGRLFSAAHDFADAWYQALHQPDDGSTQVLKLELNKDRFGLPPPGKSEQIKHVVVLMPLAEGTVYQSGQLSLTVRCGASSDTRPLQSFAAVFGGTPSAAFTVTGAMDALWTVEVAAIAPGSIGAGGGTTRLDRAKVRDFGLIFLLA